MQGEVLDTRQEVLAVLDDVLSLKGRAAGFGDSMPLLGSVPELDSMAVANVLTSLGVSAWKSGRKPLNS